MGGIQKRKKTTAKDKSKHRLLKTKHYAKDHDQIHQLFKNQNVDLPFDVDLPGAGQFYCKACNRYFLSKQILQVHQTQRKHKRRQKLMRQDPYTIQQAIQYGK